MLLILFLFGFSLNPSLHAAGNKSVVIAPTRLILEGRKTAFIGRGLLGGGTQT